MTREQIKKQFPDATEEQLKSLLDINSEDIGKTKKSNEENVKELKAQLETTKTTLKSFEGVDIEDLQGKIATLTTDIATKETDYQAKLAQMELQGKVDSHLSSKSFVNDFTKNSIKNQMLELLGSDDSKGKSYDDLLNSITQNDKGEPMPNIFVEQQQQNNSTATFNSGQSHGNPSNEDKGFNFNFTPIRKMNKEE